MSAISTDKAAEQGTREAQREQDAAKKLDTRIRKLAGEAEDKMVSLNLLIAEVIEKKTFILLGFENWQSYVSDVCATNMPQLAAVSRNTLIKFLTAKGMSVRAVANALGTSAGTVSAVNNGSDTGNPVNRKGGAPKNVAQRRRSPAIRLAETVQEWADTSEVKSSLEDLKALRARLVATLAKVDTKIAAIAKAEEDKAAADSAKAARQEQHVQGNQPRTGQVAA